MYKRSYLGAYLLFVHPEAVEKLLEELHEEICGSHMIERSLVHQALTHGYWWLSMQKQALEFSKKCDQCQKFAPSIHKPWGPLNPISSPWPFAQWGLDIVGHFPKAGDNRRWLLIGTDYYIKWVEAELLINI